MEVSSQPTSSDPQVGLTASPPVQCETAVDSGGSGQHRVEAGGRLSSEAIARQSFTDHVLDFPSRTSTPNELCHRARAEALSASRGLSLALWIAIVEAILIAAAVYFWIR